MGTILAWEEGKYLVVAHEELLLGYGSTAIASIQNQNDDGALRDAVDRQVTGLVVGGRRIIL